MPFRLFIDDFSCVLECVAMQQTECDILGDFNVHYCDDRAGNAHDLTDLCETDFQQHVMELTHVCGNILDLVLTRNTRLHCFCRISRNSVN